MCSLYSGQTRQTNLLSASRTYTISIAENTGKLLFQGNIIGPENEPIFLAEELTSTRKRLGPEIYSQVYRYGNISLHIENYMY